MTKGEERAKELGLRIKPKSLTYSGTSDGFYEADDIHKLLGEGVEMSGFDRQSNGGIWDMSEMVCGQGQPSHTHKAIMISIRPIVTDTAESLLRELVDALEASIQMRTAQIDRRGLVDRAKKLLAESEGK